MAVAADDAAVAVSGAGAASADAAKARDLVVAKGECVRAAVVGTMRYGVVAEAPRVGRRIAWLRY